MLALSRYLIEVDFILLNFLCENIAQKYVVHDDVCDKCLSCHTL